MEAELQNYLDTYESTHDYDEYHYDLDEIEHDPYVLLSIISAWQEGEWTLAEVQDTLQMLFDRQYILTEDVVVEVRYRTETRTDSEGNDYDVEVPYNYYICTVTLSNENLSHLPVYIMGEEQLSRYALYMATLGNRPDLFPGSDYVGKYTSDPVKHEVPEEYLTDETFSALLTEAEKYIGYPYVWGGSSPSTSFDCSGYLSWVLNQCGWNVGRLGAQGLYNYCTPTSSPQPGDLVFFVGTYDTPGVSHCGLYVGDGWMLHCGDPISYANLNSSYWQSHFYAYGRLPYAQPLTDREMQDYELRPARENLDIRRQMDAQAQVVGKWEDAHHVPEQRRLTWFYPDFGSYVAKEYVTPEQLAARAHGVERQAAAKARKEDKQPIAQQMKTAQKQAEEHRGQTAPKKSALRRDER